MQELIIDLYAQRYFIFRAFLWSIPLYFSYLYIDEDKSRKNVLFLINIIKKSWRRYLFFLYQSFLLVCTLVGRNIKNPYRHIFSDFGLLREGRLNTELVENFLLFIPYTFIYLLAFNTENHLKNALIISIVTTCFIELSQLLFWLGEFQFSDMLHNTAGGVAGYALWCFMRLIYRWINKNRDTIKNMF